LSDWLVSLAGTPQGAQLATALALMSAIAHAGFGALQKGRHDPWLTRGAIDLWLVIITAPVALFVVPWPTGPVFAILAGAMVIHFGYKLTMALAYTKAAYTVVYPVVRGTGPVLTAGAAILIFQEHFTALQWAGVACLSGGILGLALRNLAAEVIDPKSLKIGLAWAFLGGVLVAVYTTYDAWGIRSAADPFTFLAWFFFLTAFDFPFIALWLYRRMERPPALGPLMIRGAVGSVIAWVSFGGVMLATRLDKVGQAAVLRETSTIFAALIGWLILRETVGWLRAGLMGLIALGAVIVEFGG
jgi:drug/metabolite transporter (DMT)-like permease